MNKIKKAKQEIMQVVSQQKLPPDILQSVLENILMQIEIASLHNEINMLNGELQEIKKEQEDQKEIDDSEDTKEEIKKNEESDDDG